MHHKITAAFLLTAGFLIGATSGLDMVRSLLSPADCRKATQYDTADDTIRTCPHTIICDEQDPDKKCLRRSAIYTGPTGLTVTIVYCACGPFVLNADPTGVCHIFRRHEGAETKPVCTNGEDCTAEETCDKETIDQTFPPILRCVCS